MLIVEGFQTVWKSDVLTNALKQIEGLHEKIIFDGCFRKGASIKEKDVKAIKTAHRCNLEIL